MLKSMRKNMKAIMWVLLVTFVLWGGSSAVLSRSKTANYAGEIFAKRVGWKEFQRSYSAVESQAKLMHGEKFNQVKQYLNLEEEAWIRIMLLREAAGKHIGVSDNEVIETICRMPLFCDASNKFSPDIYRRVVEYFLKIPAREFEEQIKGTITIAKLREVIIKDVTISEEELKERYEGKNEKVNVDYVLINANDFKAQVDATDEKINQYYQAHAQEFKMPLRVNIEYIPFEYSQYKTKDEAENLASDVAYELGQQKQPNLDAAAKKFSLPVKESGFFAMNEPIPNIGLSYQIAFEAFKLEPGQISHPIKSQQGRYIIRLKDKKEPYTPSLDEIRPAVKDAVMLEEAKGLAEKKAQELFATVRGKVDSGAKFKDVCAELKLEPKSTGPFTKAGYIPQIGQSREFAKVAFAREAGKLAGIAKVPQGAAIIFITEKAAIDEEKFNKEKDNFKKAELQEKRARYFQEWLKELREKADIKVAR